jgi:hypothetical protein
MAFAALKQKKQDRELIKKIKSPKAPYLAFKRIFPSEGSSQGTVEYRRERSE